MGKDKLKRILEEYKNWLNSTIEGVCANSQHVDLRCAKPNKADGVQEPGKGAGGYR